MASLQTIFESSQSGLLKNVLTGAGITLTSSGLSLILLRQAISIFENSIHALSSDVLGLINVSGFDIFFSLIIGATLTKYAQDSTKLFLKKA